MFLFPESDDLQAHHIVAYMKIFYYYKGISVMSLDVLRKMIDKYVPIRMVVQG